MKKSAVVWRAGRTVRCGVEGEDGDACSDAVIAEAKPRTLRKRRPASPFVSAAPRARAGDCSKVMHLLCYYCSLSPRPIHLHA